MDPDAALYYIGRALEDHDRAEAARIAGNLAEWLERDGFPPEWHHEPDATAYFRKRYGDRFSVPA